MNARGLDAVSEFVSVSQAAQILGCTKCRIRQLLADSSLEGRKLDDCAQNSAWILDRQAVQRYAERNPPTSGRRGRPRISSR